MTQFITRAYNHIEKTDYNTIIKSSIEIKLKKEFYYYSDVPNELKDLFPRIINFTESDKTYNLEMEYYPYVNLGQYLLYNKPNLDIWDKISRFIQDTLERFQKNRYVLFTQHQTQDYKDSMYVKKTEKEYFNLIENFNYFKELTKFDTLIINGKKYTNFHLIWEKIKKHLFFMSRHEYKPMTFIHGDFCFSNILCGIGDDAEITLKYVDPRGTFGIDGCHGDIYYDLAKLKHSIDGGYEYIIYDLFELKKQDNQIEYKYMNNNKDDILELFEKYVFSNFDMKKVNLIQGLIYIGMCARHYDSLDRQIIMYSNGIRLLNNFLDGCDENMC